MRAWLDEIASLTFVFNQRGLFIESGDRACSPSAFHCGGQSYPDRAPLKEVLGGQYNYREGGRQVLRQGAKGRRRNRKWQCSIKDPCAQKVSGGRTDPSPKYRWKVHG